MNKKLITIESIGPIIRKIKFQKKTISLCHGVFDILHVGHIKHLKEASKASDVLIVSITGDRYIKKGLGRPYFNENLRAELLSSLSYVDYIIISNEFTGTRSIKKIRPDFYFKGIDYIGSNKTDLSLKKEIQAIKKVKGKIKYTKTTKFSSTKIINKFYKKYNSKQKTFLQSLKRDFTYSKIVNEIEKIKNLRTLIIGEGIIDEYKFVHTIGTSSKDPFIVVGNEKNKKFLGGVLSVANNISYYTKNATICSFIGKEKNLNKFIRLKLNKKLNHSFIYSNKINNIHKQRYIDKTNNDKILGIYKYNNNYINDNFQKKFNQLVKSKIKNKDLTVVSDYGHGLLNEDSARILKKSKFISVNCQLNSTNKTYENLKKYNNIDLLTINEIELRNFYSDFKSKISILARKIIKQKNVKNVIVTQGNEGLFIINSDNIITCPAFAEKIIDKVGAGDVVFFIASLCIASNIYEKLTLFLCSIGASINLENYLNSFDISKDILKKYVKNILE